MGEHGSSDALTPSEIVELAFLKGATAGILATAALGATGDLTTLLADQAKRYAAEATNQSQAKQEGRE
jgi:hypothetical protein